MKLTTALFLLSVALPIYAAPLNLNFVSSSGSNTVSYSGDQSNWFQPGCGASANYGGYNYCGGLLLGNLLPGTRASVISPNMPYATSNGYQFDFTNAQNRVVAILSISPSSGCSGSGGSTVTCGINAEFVTSTNGGQVPTALMQAFAGIPLLGSTTVDGFNQTAFVVNWSDGRVDAINAQFTAQATPEPATLGLVTAALFPLWLVRRRRLTSTVS
jgi:hypothetical protein